ncbi:tRNA A37 threonylcarbamoyladenosine dehydratase [Peptoclostridium litorale DSM 5388]|uniref:tRNA threonylcarbamoyladenosine dehydratase TcdA n=1 Tax=Peptoclostridium litorale DSM 5388 TaxID=1121324 RepID=A0A069RDB0_PEPLI|nr:tRNA threonylcarbamoyladenosine dehydratase [Peptoclostridium litorale]KDR95049.1 tRNA threonylcarbamoyladenosine dehydratase TcdA [Peptoclostridium litorale DSM 5388]SIN75869.1 tRNA A37 threonylcarbamoyladenosine dehydratase [Peptoclostridium litorale DSM 5388]
MYSEILQRTRMLVGEHGIEKLKNSNVLILGIGGVGGFAAEAIARAGVGNITIVDKDTVDITNINRQIVALQSTIGKSKVDVMKGRIADINPATNVNAINALYNSETADSILSSDYDYVVDAIDMVSSKIDLIKRCHDSGISIISSMGMGNKLDPTKISVSDIYKTSMCPLARVMRKELKSRMVKKLNVVYSTEKPVDVPKSVDPESKKVSPGSISFVPSAAGLIMASVVINGLLQRD